MRYHFRALVEPDSRDLPHTDNEREVWIVRYAPSWGTGRGKCPPVRCRCLRRHLKADSEELERWVQYAVRLARAWSALVLAAELCGLVPTTPPLILADALNDIGDFGLENLLRVEFGGWQPWQDTEASPLVLPELPDGALGQGKTWPRGLV